MADLGRRAALLGGLATTLPTVPGLAADAPGIDANDLAREAVIAGLNRVPEVGDLLGALTGILWPPTAADVWGQIRAQVEALVEQKLNAATLADVGATLQGLKAVAADYKVNVKGNRAAANAAYSAAEAAFDQARPHFIAVRGSELLLLPLTAQMANLHLAVLRDGVLFGAKWGRDEAWLAQKRTKLAGQIKEYEDFARGWVINGFIAAGPLPPYRQKALDEMLYGPVVTRAQHASVTPLAVAQFHARTWSFYNEYVRGMTRSVLDHAQYWPNFDPATKSIPPLTREIFSAIQGIPAPGADVGAGPAAALTSVSVFAGAGVSGVQVNQGPRQGRTDGTLPAGWNAAVAPANPITQVDGRSGLAVDMLQFTRRDGSKSPVAGNAKNGEPFTAHFAGHALSSIRVLGASDRVPQAASVLLGFRPLRDLAQPAPALMRSASVGNAMAGLSLFDFHDKVLPVQTVWVNADGDKLRGIAWQYRLGNRLSFGDVPADPSSLPKLALNGAPLAGITLFGSGYGYGSARRIELALSGQPVFAAGAGGGEAVQVPAGGMVLAGFYGTINVDRFVNALGVYLRPA